MDKFIKKKQNKLILLTSFMIFVFVSIWSAITPIWSDDIRNIINNKGISLQQIFLNQSGAYFSWSGRVIGESISSFLVSIGRIPFGILNGLVFTMITLLVLLIANDGNLKGKNIFRKYIFGLMLIFWLMPSFGQVVLWTSGAGNYLWTAMFNLLFIWYFLYGVKFKSKLLLISILFLSFISGWSNENTGIGVILFLILQFILNRKDNHFIVKRIVISIFYIIGYLFLILAPGNTVRAYSHDTAFMKLSFANRIITRIFGLNNIIDDKLIIPIILCFIFISLCIVNKKFNVAKSIIPFIVAIISMIYSLVMSPELDPNAGRMFLFTFLLMVIVILRCFNLSINNDISKFVNIMVFLVVALETVLSVSSGFIDSVKTDKAINERNALIKNERKHYDKDKGIIVKPLAYTGQTKYSVVKETFFDMTDDPNFVYNVVTSKAFDVSKITVK